ncbi:MAG: hypothetical protein PHE48_02045 [Candidatus Daviesbacteria bacterium]|nr:hypothetical protein [Candidatus Daviesbacteria bacterium]
MKLVLVLILFWVLVFPKNANAYLDPGSGSYIIFNEYFVEQLPLLEDISYAQVRYRTPYNVFNVTNLMK